MRVRGEAAVQRAAEIGVAQGLERLTDLDRRAARFDQPQRLAGEADDIGVDRVECVARTFDPLVRPAPCSPLSERIQRLRYQSARPFSIRIPWIMPSPENQ